MAKVRVRYVGAASAAILSSTENHPSIQFQRYGQLIELDEEVYKDIISGTYGAKLALILDEEFATLGHPESELARYGAFESHAGASDEFKARRLAADGIMVKNHAAASVPPPDTDQPKE